jgi:hypothetical protein
MFRYSELLCTVRTIHIGTDLVMQKYYRKQI